MFKKRINGIYKGPPNVHGHLKFQWPFLHGGEKGNRNRMVHRNFQIFQLFKQVARYIHTRQMKG